MTPRPGGSPFTTLVQLVPQLPRVLARMRPTWQLGSLAELDAAFLAAQGIEGLIWDVDGTLTGDQHPALEPAAERPFRALLARPGLRHVILSNASESRYRQLALLFAELPVLRAYRQGGEVLFRRRVLEEEHWSPDDGAARLARGAQVIRKPSAILVEYAVRELGCPAERVAMVGDQYLTDVAGANLAGVRSVKLPTLAAGSFRGTVRAAHRLERLLYRLLYRG
jgi:predicted HAD superfamily phosphohydrolase YqeG